jgi:hypothetical protein
MRCSLPKAGSRREGWHVHRSPFAVRRSPFTVHRGLGVRGSEFGVLKSAIRNPQSEILTRRYADTPSINYPHSSEPSPGRNRGSLPSIDLESRRGIEECIR